MGNSDVKVRSLWGGGIDQFFGELEEASPLPPSLDGTLVHSVIIFMAERAGYLKQTHLTEPIL